jgi:hypothetical protein
MTHWVDYKQKRAIWPFWTHEETRLLREGKAVPSRTSYACQHRRSKLGLTRANYYLAWAPYEPPAPPAPGAIPWPKWWKRAHLMRKEGYNPAEISRALGKCQVSVRRALYPAVKARGDELHNERQRKRRQNPGIKQAEVTNWKPADHKRSYIRAMARAEWRASGGKPDDLEKLYRKYECP